MIFAGGPTGTATANPVIACLHRAAGLASSSTGRNSGAAGPFFGNFERDFDRLIEILAQHEGVFRPVLPENLGKPPRNGSIGAPHRDWPMPIDQLVEITGGSLRALSCSAH
jgi:hypothetical protein